MFRKMPIILLGVIGLIALCDSYIPISLKSVLYALSLTIKSIIIFVLPFIIFTGLTDYITLSFIYAFPSLPKFNPKATGRAWWR